MPAVQRAADPAGAWTAGAMPRNRRADDLSHARCHAARRPARNRRVGPAPPDARRSAGRVCRITKAGLKLLAKLDRPLIDMHRRSLVHMTRRGIENDDRLLVKIRPIRERRREILVRLPHRPCPKIGARPVEWLVAARREFTLRRPIKRSLCDLLRCPVALLLTLRARWPKMRFSPTNSKITLSASKTNGWQWGVQCFSGT